MDSSFIVEVSEPITVKNISKEALDNKLYVNKKYMLYSILTYISINYNPLKFKWTKDKVKHKRDYFICTSVKDKETNKPVGILLIYGFLIMFYIKKEYRNKGLTDILIKETAKKHDLTAKLVFLGTSRASLKILKKYNLSKSIKDMRYKLTNV